MTEYYYIADYAIHLKLQEFCTEHKELTIKERDSTTEINMRVTDSADVVKGTELVELILSIVEKCECYWSLKSPRWDSEKVRADLDLKVIWSIPPWKNYRIGAVF